MTARTVSEKRCRRETRRARYLAKAVKVSRIIGWFAFGSMFLCVFPLAWGAFHAAWLDKHGSDEPMPEGWKISWKS